MPRKKKPKCACQPPCFCRECYPKLPTTPEVWVELRGGPKHGERILLHPMLFAVDVPVLTREGFGAYRYTQTEYHTDDGLAIWA